MVTARLGDETTGSIKREVTSATQVQNPVNLYTSATPSDYQAAIPALFEIPERGWSVC